MAAAPNLPISEAMTWDLEIGTNYTPSRQGIVVNQGDEINFENNSGVDISIVFQPNGNGQAVYPPMTINIVNTEMAGFYAPSYNCAANYNIYQLGTQPPVQLSGPFAIQVGTGPIYVTIGGTPSSPTYTPQTVAVPRGTALPPGAGELQMNATSSAFVIAWSNNSDPFTPSITSPDGAPHAVSLSSSSASYSYNAGASPNENPAGGKVIIQN